MLLTNTQNTFIREMLFQMGYPSKDNLTQAGKTSGSPSYPTFDISIPGGRTLFETEIYMI
jgi:hypothetical protein